MPTRCASTGLPGKHRRWSLAEGVPSNGAGSRQPDTPLAAGQTVSHHAYMERPWTRPFREALRYTTDTVASVANDAGLARITLDTYKNRREPSRSAALALADAIEGKSKKLQRYADEIREACRESPGGTSP